MTLRDLMASHMPALLSTEHFGQDVTVTAKGIVKSFTLRVVMGDQVDAYAPDGSVVVQQSTRAVMVFQRSVWRRAIGPIATNASQPRDVQRGDQVVIAAGLPYAGTWIVADATADEGDASQAQLVRPDHQHLGGAGAVELQ